MSNLREIASRCEAKLHAFRRTQDGVVVSFVVHPAEVPPVLALDPLGTRYMLAFVAIGDDEQPASGMAGQLRDRPELTAAIARARATYEALSPEEREAHDKAQRESWVRGNLGLDRDERAEQAKASAKERYAAMSPGERAVARAAMLPKDERFRAWATEELSARGQTYTEIISEDTAAMFIRQRCCGGKSRKLIAEDPEYMDRFQAMLTEFMLAVGEIPEIR